MISRSDIGEYMQKIAEEQGFLTAQKPSFISSLMPQIQHCLAAGDSTFLNASEIF